MVPGPSVPRGVRRPGPEPTTARGGASVIGYGDARAATVGLDKESDDSIPKIGYAPIEGRVTECKHTKLTFVEESSERRVRCQHCHLTITDSELAGGYCPECYETAGVKRYAFDRVPPAAKGPQRLRCEDCALLIDVEDTTHP